MTRELRWDGMRVDIPDGLEPAVLDRGFVRLVPDQRAPRGGNAERPHAPEAGLELRCGPAKSGFSPDRDGRRLLRACGVEGSLTPFCPAWGAGREMWAGPDESPRLFVSLFDDGVVAALFPSPPGPELLRTVLCPLDWTPPDAWRQWLCYDLSFETPPGAALTAASFRPGAFRLEFRQGGTTLTFERLAPADVLLNGEALDGWLRRYTLREHGSDMAITPLGPSEARFERPMPPWRRALPWLPAGPERLHGMVRLTTNRLLVLTERGRPIPQPDFERIYASHCASTIQG